MFDYEGCQDIERAWREGLTPDPLLTVSEWADRHRMLSTKASAEPGRWRTSRTPYLQAIMDCLSPTSPVERVVFMKGGQVGGPLALHTPVPLDGGWTTMGGIRVGDRVLDECGRPCRVTGVSKVLRPSRCYALRLDDGEQLICDGKHRWPVLDLVAGGAGTLYTSEMRGRVRLPGRGRRYRYAIDARGLKETHQRRITEILEVDPEPLRCIEVGSPNHQYLCGKGYVPTHNTECGNNWIGYVIHHAPGPMMAVSPTVEMAKRNSKQRIDPLIEESPILRELIAPHRSRDSGNTILAKEFRGGVLVMTGANSAVGLRSMPVRYLFLDEVDGYPGDVEGEGDALSLACARTRTFARRKIFIVSTPTIAGVSSIEREFEASDQRRYFVPCPQCGHRQWLRFEQLRWTREKPETASYICESCSAEIGEHHKGWMLEHGEWRTMAPENAGKTAGFHLSSLYSPVGWRAWREIAAAGDPPRARPRRSSPSRTPSSARLGSRRARRPTGSGSWSVGRITGSGRCPWADCS